MARLRRLAVPGQLHLITQRGNNGQALFLDAHDHDAYVQMLGDAGAVSKVAIHAYALTESEVHVLATPADAQGLSRMMQTLGRRYVAAFNRRHGRTGTLWEGRFRATVVQAERYLWDCLRFVELAPVRQGLVSRPEDWPWSSAGHHLGLRGDAALTTHPLYWSLGNTPFERDAAHRQLLERALTVAEVKEIGEASAKGWALGNAEFISDVERQSERRARPAKRGRPVKPMRPQLSEGEA